MGKLTPSIPEERNAQLSAKYASPLGFAKQFLDKDISRDKQTQVANNIIGVNLAMIGARRPDLTDAEDCAGALEYYFQLNATYSVRPTISGIAMALGLDRDEFNRACEVGEVYKRSTGATLILPQAVLELFRQAKKNYVSMMEGFMESGSLHPACGIFMLKNNAGYKDVVEQRYTVTHASVDSETLEKKYKQELEGLD